jgi:hypothetical protein
MALYIGPYTSNEVGMKDYFIPLLVIPEGAGRDERLIIPARGHAPNTRLVQEASNPVVISRVFRQALLIWRHSFQTVIL